MKRSTQPATFLLESPWIPQGDQPQAIASLVSEFCAGRKQQTLMGVTGSGKTFTMANVIAQMGLPTLVMAHNKTLAAQLYDEFRELFPHNAVEYFVSYYDYYQPEAYVPASDTYIDKDSNINDAIDRMRHSATQSLLERNDVIIVSSVSCIYGLGSPDAYYEMLVILEVGQNIDRNDVIRKLIDLQFIRNDIDFHRGTFRVRGDAMEIIPANEDAHAVRIEWFGDVIEKISRFDVLTRKSTENIPKVTIYPSSHYVVTPVSKQRAMQTIKDELRQRLETFQTNNRLLEAQRLEQRTVYDLEMLAQMGYCNGIENYSRHFTGLAEGAPPPTLLDYFPKDFLLIVDESHQTIPQVGAMFKGDRSRKQTLVDYGFRLPSALDNRPLKFDEFETRVDRVIYASATPGPYEFKQCEGVVVEQIIRPTGLLDPPIEIRPAAHQIDDLLAEIRVTLAQGYRVLVTTLTKRFAEDLTEFFQGAGVKVRYMHSDIDTLERIDILKDFRLGVFDVLVGINLLREGLDLPEVALVAVLDADKEGFLRSETSLIQTVGRAARNRDGRVIFYADKITRSIRAAMDETDRRRAKQQAFNTAHGIEPKSTVRTIQDMPKIAQKATATVDHDEAPEVSIITLRAEMMRAAEALEFERAAILRDKIRVLEASDV